MKIRNDKIEVLINYWDKIITKIQFKTGEKKDIAGDKLIAKIMFIPEEIIYEALRYYIKKCRYYYNIAFF